MMNKFRPIKPPDVSKTLDTLYTDHFKSVEPEQLQATAATITSELLKIDYVTSYLPMSERSNVVLGDLIKAYLISIQPWAGWHLEKDDRFVTTKLHLYSIITKSTIICYIS